MKSSFENRFSLAVLALMAFILGVSIGSSWNERDVKADVIPCTAAEDPAACIEWVFQLRERGLPED